MDRLGVFCLLGDRGYRATLPDNKVEPLAFDLNGAGPALARTWKRAMEHRAANRHPSAREPAADLTGERKT